MSNFLNKISGLFSAKSIVNEIDDANFSVLDNGLMTYNYETYRHELYNLNQLFGSADSVSHKGKWYYENVPFFADCVDIYVNTALQVELSEVDKDGNKIENSRFVEFLQQPNNFQDFQSFLKEAVINVLADGVNVMYSNAVERGDLYVSMQNVLYNLEWTNLEMPKVENIYEINRKEYDNLQVKEYLCNGKYRTLRLGELMFVYDKMPRRLFGDNGYHSGHYFEPISRVRALQTDLNILLNTANTMDFVSGKNLTAIVSKKSQNGELAPLGTAEKADIERKLAGYSKYGTNKGQMDMIAVNEYLDVQNIQRNNRLLNLIEMQNNSKENIRSNFGVPRDLLDAHSGTSRGGSTYENQQTAEARFTLSNVKSVTDIVWYSFEKRFARYFGENRLVGTYDHTPSVLELQSKIKNEGFEVRADAYIKLLDAYAKIKEPGMGMENISWDSFIDDNGFREYIKEND